ncbi:MAG: hypothetical protein ACJ74U_18730 [Jatrophihabitantaceae bacterium]
MTEKEKPQFTLPLPGLGGALFRRLVVGRGYLDDLRLVAYLRSTPPALLHGRPTTLLRLAACDPDANGCQIRPGAILVSGEYLFDEDRVRLEGSYGCPVLNAYTSVEGGLIGLECPLEHTLHVPPGRVLEVAQEDGDIHETGFGEIVLTNLVNWATIFIRYRTGDRGTVVDGVCGCGYTGQSIVAFQGREVTKFWVNGRFVAASALGACIAGTGVREYQLAQERGGFGLRWRPQPNDDPPAVEQALRSALQQHLDATAIQITAVDRLVPSGGKAWRFRNLEP